MNFGKIPSKIVLMTLTLSCISLYQQFFVVRKRWMSLRKRPLRKSLETQIEAYCCLYDDVTVVSTFAKWK